MKLLSKKNKIINLAGIAFILTAGLFSATSCDKNNKNEHSTPSTPEQNIIVSNMIDSNVSYKIVTPETNVEGYVTYKYAADQIVEYFEKVSGKVLPIITDAYASYDANATYISLGPTSIYDAAESSRIKINYTYENFNLDGFYIFTQNKSLFINSYIPRGTLYGAYEIIEKLLDVRFLTYDFTYIPTKTSVPLYSFDKLYRPLFEQRSYLNSPVFLNDKDYVSHMRFNTDFAPLDEKYGGYTEWCTYDEGSSAGTHSMPIIVKASEFVDGDKKNKWGQKLFKEEYQNIFSHDQPDAEGNVNYRWVGEDMCDLCYSDGVNDDGSVDSKAISTVKILVEKLKYFILKYNTCNNFMLGQADTPYICTCSKCARNQRLYKNSGIMIRFANCVSDLINQWLQDEQIDRQINFTIFAYAYTDVLPVDSNGQLIHPTCKPRDNVFIKYAPISTIYYFSLDDERQIDDSEGVEHEWAKISDTLLTWTYHTMYSEYFFYYSSMGALKDLLKNLAKAGVIYEMAQGAYTENAAYQQHVEAYVFAKLCWDINANVEDILDDFLLHYFGESAFSYVKAYHEETELTFIQEVAERGEMQVRTIDKAASSLYWTLSKMNKFISYFDNAIEATLNNNKLTSSQKDAYVTNLEKAKMMPLWTRLRNCQEYQNITNDDRNSYADAFFDLCGKYGVKYTGEAISVETKKAEFVF